MSGRKPILGVNATFHAKPEQKQVVWDFLAGAKAIVDDEPDTLQWFAIKFDDSPDGELGAYSIIDTFPSVEARNAHIGGRIPAAIVPRVPELLSQPPAIDSIDIIASKVSKNAASESKLQKGVIVYITAKEESAAQVKALLTGSYASAIAQEQDTHYWYAFQKDATTFGLSGIWHTEKERADHLGGPAVADVFAGLAPLIAKPAVLLKGEIIAQKTQG